MLRDRLHIQLAIRAETTPDIRDYSVYAPSFSYVSNGREKQASFVISARFNDGHLEFWDSTWEQTPSLDTPLALARSAHAKLFGAVHRLFTVTDLETNRVLAKNRQTVYSYLASDCHAETSELETRILTNLPSRSPTTLRELACLAGESQARTNLAAFRLVVAGRVVCSLEDQLISPEWQVRRGKNATA
jgi:hypothetical protein